MSTILSKYLKNSGAKLSNFIIYLLLLVAIASIITYFTINMQYDFNPMWDTYDFLVNALQFAGKGIDYADLTRPPFLSFLTSIIFRFGYISESVIFAIDGLIFIFGVIGLYLALNLRFNPFKSFIGCLIYVTSPIILTYNTLGMTDISSVSFIIWGIYFIILAFKKNNKYFYLSFPFLMISFLTRYSSALIVFPVVLYLLMNKKRFKNSDTIKNFIIGLIISVIVITPVLVWFYMNFSNPFYPFIDSLGTTLNGSMAELRNYDNDSLYFIKNLSLLLGKEPMAIILIVICGFVYYKIKSPFWIKLNFREKLTDVYYNKKMLLLVILIPFFIITFGNIYYMLDEVIFLIICVLAYEILKRSSKAHLDTDLLFISWFMSFFIFHSVYVIKDIRYLISMAPSFSYLFILGLKEISNRFELKNRNYAFKIISIFLILTLFLSAASTLLYLKEESYIHSTYDDLKLASDWLKEYDPLYKDKVIYSDAWPVSAWYLRTDIKKMPIYKDNHIYYARLKELKLNNNDFRVYNQKLENGDADYYFRIFSEMNLTSYIEIKRFGKVIIYKKINT